MTMDAIVENLKSERADLAAGLERIDAALAVLTAGAPVESAPVKEASGKGGRRKMTAAQRRAISERMKKSWAERKKKAKA